MFIIMKSIKNIVIVGCLHGDEIIGKKVIEYLKDMTFKKNVSFVLGNKKAISRGVRFITSDLNRSFPGKEKGGTYEEYVAFYLLQKIQNADMVIDIHATGSHFDSAVIVSDMSFSTKKILSLVPIRKVLVIRKNSFGNGRGLIHHVKGGISVEYGYGKGSLNTQRALKDILQILINSGALGGKREIISKKVYEVKKEYRVPNGFVVSKRLRDFKRVEKGQFLGKENGEAVYSKDYFYPVFLGEGKYEGTLCLETKMVH